ncbi:MAG: ATP-NAD kinase family protein, partial [Synergistaceae bacterium]|nr:ATP-NAD kinase family protein [Synergistaceae bacterium]
MAKIGFIVNPYAGIGGRLALKGSDGDEVRERAIMSGVEGPAPVRAATFLNVLSAHMERAHIVTYGGDMGATCLRAAGFQFELAGEPAAIISSASDTADAASRMLDAAVDCLVFLGGDGTARDICAVVRDAIPVVGVPSGVKMHSAVFARTPADAALLVSMLIGGKNISYRPAEVMDIDEKSFREGRVSAALYGYMTVPYAAEYLQGPKASGCERGDALRGAAERIAGNMEDGIFYVVGPGTSTKYIFDLLGLGKTLLGVDVLLNKRVVSPDASYDGLKKILHGNRYNVIVTAIGGQGCLFGRGNQQIGPDILRPLKREDITVIASTEKLLSITGGAMYNDTGDPELDRQLSGYYRVITGWNE